MFDVFLLLLAIAVGGAVGWNETFGRRARERRRLLVQREIRRERYRMTAEKNRHLLNEIVAGLDKHKENT